MAQSYRTKFLVSLTAGCLLSVATLAQAQSRVPAPLGTPVQKCTTRYNTGMGQYETVCEMQHKVRFTDVFQTRELKEWKRRFDAEWDAMTPQQKERMPCMGRSYPRPPSDPCSTYENADHVLQYGLSESLSIQGEVF